MASDEPDKYQRRALRAVLVERKNVFITGPAGTGKSWTLRRLVHEARTRDYDAGGALNVVVCASTGLAAVELQCGATTVHNFLGFRDCGERSVGEYVRQLREDSHRPHLQKIMEMDLLIIDEISMTCATLLAKVEGIISSLRRNPAPYGGVQVAFFGDFAQLQPVDDRKPSKKRKNDSKSLPLPKPKLAFHATRAWVDARVRTYNLLDLHRQAEDTAYAAVLNRVRFNRLTDEDNERIRSRLRRDDKVIAEASLTHVMVDSHNAVVDEKNASRLAMLDERTRHLYPAHSMVIVRNETLRPATEVRCDAREFMTQAARTKETIELRVGARVLLLANLDVSVGLAKGCVGTVVSFDERAEGVPMPFVKFDNLPHEDPIRIDTFTWRFDGDPEWTGSYEQLPLTLAWAITVHRSQGLTLPRVIADCHPRKMFSPGMAYVLFSRVRRLDDLILTNYSRASVYTTREVREFYDAA